MANHVERVPSVAAVPTGPSGGGLGSSARNPDPPVPEAGRYRLVIEEGPRQGLFVYKTLDRITGEVVRQFPREEVVKFANSAPGAGKVIDTSI